MAYSPPRDRDVYFVGAGLSCALGLPNTAALIDGVLDLARAHPAWGITRDLPARLNEAFAFFYPDGADRHFRPDVADFFATLATYVDIGEGLPGTRLPQARSLFEELQFAICHLLIARIRIIDEGLSQGHPLLDTMVAPGNIIVTSNWDFLLERYAWHKRVPIRHSGRGASECVILKLHGSMDWLALPSRPRNSNGRPRYPDHEYCTLDERLFGRPYTKGLPTDEDALVRVRAFENLNNAWQTIKSRANQLYMVTMGTGKGSRLGPLDSIWVDAYQAISRAQSLDIVGYSMPPDDIEIRTLLRAGLRRSGHQGGPVIKVCNPSPDVHHRIRSLLDREIQSEYRPVDGLS